LRLFRKRSVAHATDSASTLSLPRVRMGLLTKLNLLTIGLIFLTAIGTTGFYVWQQWRDETADLRQRGASALAMLTELSEFGLYNNNRAYLEAILASLSTEGDIAYAAIVFRRHHPVLIIVGEGALEVFDSIVGEQLVVKLAYCAPKLTRHVECIVSDLVCHRRN